jgi:hypothetical protein
MRTNDLQTPEEKAAAKRARKLAKKAASNEEVR